MKIYNQDCLYKLKELDDNSVDSIVTDPPYGLSFMGKKWDYDVPSIDIWIECLRVLKLGGHLLAFAGSRTYHRMAVRIEDAGFEIRDQIMWIYGSGFPKSHNIGKALDKRGGQNLSWFIDYVLKVAKEKNIPKKELDMLFLSKNGKPTGWIWNKKNGEGITLKQYNTIKDFLDLPFDSIEETEREFIGNKKTNLTVMKNIGKDNITGEIEVTKGNSKWEGWGTALKPAHEPIVMARKPFKGTVVNNVLEWGTGGINIDESRVGTVDTRSKASMTALGQNSGWNKHSNKEVIAGSVCGRFPANIILDEEAGKILDKQSGISKSGKSRGLTPTNARSWKNSSIQGINRIDHDDKGGASRFFYCPKTSKKDRNEGLDEFKTKQTVGGGGGIGNYENDVNSSSGKFGSEKAPSKNNHPTVKPTDLMLYLIRLVTPKGGTTLDPFMGSGSTGKAAIRGGFDFIGIEREKEYIEIAKARIKYEQEKQKPDSQIKLF